jgi:endonuclease/exonuclease/phosphatase family metal-dependent hydrolase
MHLAGSSGAAPQPHCLEGQSGLYVVSLNIQFARQVARVCRLFESVPELRRAHVVLLQEMDPSGTEAIARCLGMRHVYYPATVHVKTGRDFGNAVLSAWPIIDSRKLELPHRSLRDRSRRVATYATLAAPLAPIEVCSLHLATPLELLPGARREQLRAVLSEVRGAPRVILGGDFNSYRLGKLVPPDRFEWATRGVGATLRWLSVDHIFTHGLRASAAGKVPDTLSATDHAAVWVRLEHAS